MTHLMVLGYIPLLCKNFDERFPVTWPKESATTHFKAALELVPEMTGLKGAER